MIAAFAVYALLLGLLLGALALLLERGARQVGSPTRFIWAVAMAAMAVLPAVGAMLRGADTSVTPEVLTGPDASTPLCAPDVAASGEITTSFFSMSGYDILNVWRDRADRRPRRRAWRRRPTDDALGRPIGLSDGG